MEDLRPQFRLYAAAGDRGGVRGRVGRAAVAIAAMVAPGGRLDRCGIVEGCGGVTRTALRRLAR